MLPVRSLCVFRGRNIKRIYAATGTRLFLAHASDCILTFDEAGELCGTYCMYLSICLSVCKQDN